MERAHVNGVELEYEVSGSGEPVLLVHGGLLADENTPLAREPALTTRYRVVNYHRRGFAGSSRNGSGVSIETHAADAKALLDTLGIARAHVVGHSLGGTVSLQLALDHPERVHSLVLLEPALMAAIAKSTASPEEARESQRQFESGMAKVREVYATGDKRGALTTFLETRAGQAFREVLDWLTRTGEFDQAVRDADTFLDVEMPAAYAWEFTPERARAISQPVLSVLGSHSPERARRVHEILKLWVPQTETLVLPRADHALPLMDPPGIAETIAGWLGRHPIAVRAGGAPSSLARWAPASGVAWVGLVGSSFAVSGLGPPPGSKARDFPKYFRAKRRWVLAGTYLRSVGVLASFPFVAHLCEVLREAEGEPAPLAMTSFGSIIAGHAIAIAGNAFHGAAAFRADEISTELAETLFYLGSVFYAGAFPLVPFMLANAAVILRTGVLPRWLGLWAAIDAPVLLLGRMPIESRVAEGIDVLGIIAFLAWVVTVSRKLRPGSIGGPNVAEQTPPAPAAPAKPRRRRALAAIGVGAFAALAALAVTGS